MRGPKPKPTKLKLLEGNAGRRPLNNLEPEFSGFATPPDYVEKDPVALAEWARRAPELKDLGLLADQYRTEFADYCINHSICLALLKKIDVQDPELAIAKGYMKAYFTASKNRQNLAAKFGFTPSDSTRIKTSKKDKEASGAARFLA